MKLQMLVIIAAVAATFQLLILLPWTQKLHSQTLKQAQNSNLLKEDDAIYHQLSFDSSPIVIEEHNLIFFTIPKVSCTIFKRLFRRMLGYSDWQTKYAHDPKNNGLRYLVNYSLDEANKMLIDPTWTRAIFVRDPKERVVSAFLDKAVRNHGQYVVDHCCHHFKDDPRTLKEWLLFCPNDARGVGMVKNKVFNSDITFEQFVGHILPKCDDPHWTPQHMVMADKFWPIINFIGHFERIQEDTKRLLFRLGQNTSTLWDQFGESGWGGTNNSIYDKELSVAHGTGAKNYLSMHLNTPALHAQIEHYYYKDYDHFHYQK